MPNIAQSRLFSIPQRRMNSNITLRETVASIVTRHMLCYSEQECAYILAGLNMISTLDLNFDIHRSSIDIKNFQENLSKINEKELRRRDEGVYYTPKDITEYIVANTYLNYLQPDNTQVYSVSKCVQIITRTNYNKLFNAKIFDPTCGTAEFLLSALNLKLQILAHGSDDDILEIITTIYGNDIAEESILLSKIRIFFAVIHTLSDKSNAPKVAKILNKNFTVHDYIINDDISPKYDIIIGNPPYIEYGKLPQRPQTNYGNSYADVLRNAILSAKESAVIGFVIPLSFVSTTRMKGIRDYAYEKLKKIFVLNFADRPDCLFDGVHQKLTILLGVKGKNKCDVYSSSYYHWYCDERDRLLNNATVLPVKPNDRYIPKIGTIYEHSIFEKILSTKGKSFGEIIRNADNATLPVYLNMRGCFWMKAFSFNPGSNEYKLFNCPKDMQAYILCLLNSNLFFLYWTIVSDCWHITGKELSEFIIPTNDIDFNAFRGLVSKLEQKLENTKSYIGSKQTVYEYKHKECKKEIDEIDILLQQIYCLTNEEIEFLKNYNIRYRMSNG